MPSISWKMLSTQIALTLVILCSIHIHPTESRYREKTRDKSEPSPLATQQKYQQVTVPKVSLNLCSKDRAMKLVCHCTPDDVNIKASKADCWIFLPDLPKSDPSWSAFHSQTQLQNLKFTVHVGGNLSLIPTDVLQILKFLKTISIEYGQIHEVLAFAFGNLTQLTNISLPHNQVQKIHTYAFANHQHLVEISLEQNEIDEIDRYAFLNLPNLNRLNLEHNKLEQLQDDTFEHLVKLNELLLQHNYINLLTRETFKGLGNLKNLNLSNNKLTFIGDTVFAELWSLQELSLEDNQIEKISERAFDGLNNLKRLNLENNHLKLLERGLFTGVPALIYLNLMKNSLETITFNNILPLMDNLVNNTSELSINENFLICDCRLSWIFDLKDHTKNEKLRESLEDLECIMKVKEEIAHKSNVLSNTEVKEHIATGEEVEYYEDEAYDEGKMVHLLKLKVSELPCPGEHSQSTDLPLSREIGLDLSWLSSSASVRTLAKINLSVVICVLITIFKARGF